MNLLKAVRIAYYDLGTPLYGRGYWQQPTSISSTGRRVRQPRPRHRLHCTAIEMDVDRETGQVRLIRAAHGDDAGQPIHPVMLEGQVNGGSAHMTGHALMEDSLYDEKGRNAQLQLAGLQAAHCLDVPSISSTTSTHMTVRSFGAKGAGEASSCSSLAAIATGLRCSRRAHQRPAHHARRFSQNSRRRRASDVCKKTTQIRLPYPASLPEAVKLLSPMARMPNSWQAAPTHPRHEAAHGCPWPPDQPENNPAFRHQSRCEGSVHRALTTWPRSRARQSSKRPTHHSGRSVRHGIPQVRTLATIGGNLVSAVPSADTAPPLMVLSAQAHITGPAGERTCPVEALFAGPSACSIAPGDVVTRITIPLPQARRLPQTHAPRRARPCTGGCCCIRDPRCKKCLYGCEDRAGRGCPTRYVPRVRGSASRKVLTEETAAQVGKVAAPSAAHYRCACITGIPVQYGGGAYKASPAPGHESRRPRRKK